MSRANVAPEKIDDRKRGSPSQGDSYVSVWPCSNPYLSTSWTLICSTRTLWRVKSDADKSQLQHLRPKQKNNLRCQRSQMPYIQSMLDQTSPSSEALPWKVLSQWNDHLVKESVTSSLGAKDEFQTSCLQERRARLPSIGIPLHTPCQRLNHTLLAVMRPAQSIELFWIQYCTTDG